MNYKVIIFLALLVSACQQESETPAVTPGASSTETTRGTLISHQQFESAGMELTSLSEQPFYESIIANGLFEVPPKYQSSVSAYYGGYVQQLDLLPGEYVKRGQVLFTLENPAFIQTQREFLEASSQLTYLKAEYERLKALAEENGTARKNFLKAEADYNLTRVQYAALKKELELMRIDTEQLNEENIRTRITVLAPISGYIMDVLVHKGQLLTPEEEALNIINKDHLHLELSIFEKDQPKLEKGQTIRFSTPNLPGETYEAEVYLVNPNVNKESRKLMVHGHLKNEPEVGLFHPGNYIEGEILTSSSRAMALPSQAVVELDNSYYVLVLETDAEQGYRFTQKKVNPGRRTADFVEVLNAGDFSTQDRFLGEGAFGMIQE